MANEMSRTAARVRHDEVTRLVKPLLALGLRIASVEWDGERVSVKIGDSKDKSKIGVDGVNGGVPVHEVDHL